MLNRVSVSPWDTEGGSRGPDQQSTSVDFLSLLGPINRSRLLSGSARAEYPAGAIAIHPLGPPFACLIESGLARSYWNLPDGRQATINIVRPKELVGGTTVMGHSPWLFMQAVTDTTLTILDLDNVRNLAATDVEVSTAIATQLAMRVRDAYRLIAVRSLGNITERMAYDLLDRACRSLLDVGRLEVRATQTDLADSIGSSREVMSRALRELRVAGIVETAPGVIRVLNPGRLAAIVRAFVI